MNKTFIEKYLLKTEEQRALYNAIRSCQGKKLIVIGKYLGYDFPSDYTLNDYKLEIAMNYSHIPTEILRVFETHELKEMLPEVFSYYVDIELSRRGELIENDERS